MKIQYYCWGGVCCYYGPDLKNTNSPQYFDCLEKLADWIEKEYKNNGFYIYSTEPDCLGYLFDRKFVKETPTYHPPRYLNEN